MLTKHNLYSETQLSFGLLSHVQVCSVGTALLWASLVAQTVKNLPANTGDTSSIPGLGRSPGEGNGNPLQYSCLGNHMDREPWRATDHGVPKSQIQLGDYATTNPSLFLDKEQVLCLFCSPLGNTQFYTHWKVPTDSSKKWKLPVQHINQNSFD